MYTIEKVYTKYIESNKSNIYVIELNCSVDYKDVIEPQLFMYFRRINKDYDTEVIQDKIIVTSSNRFNGNAKVISDVLNILNK